MTPIYWRPTICLVSDKWYLPYKYSLHNNKFIFPFVLIKDAWDWQPDLLSSIKHIWAVCCISTPRQGSILRLVSVSLMRWELMLKLIMGSWPLEPGPQLHLGMPSQPNWLACPLVDFHPKKARVQPQVITLEAELDPSLPTQCNDLCWK